MCGGLMQLINYNLHFIIYIIIIFFLKIKKLFKIIKIHPWGGVIFLILKVIKKNFFFIFDFLNYL